MEIRSALNEIITDIYSTRTIKEAKRLFIEFINMAKIKDADKKKMLDDVEKITTLRQIQMYTTNVMFKYEGLDYKNK